MSKTIDPLKLFHIDEKVQGWTHILDHNMKRLDALFLRLNEIIDVYGVESIQDRDLLQWDAVNQRWNVIRFYDYFPTTTTTTMSGSTSSTSSSTASTMSGSTTSSSTTSSTLSTTSSTLSTTSSTHSSTSSSTSSSSSSSTASTMSGSTTTSSTASTLSTTSSTLSTTSSTLSTTSTSSTTTSSSTTSSSSTTTITPSGDSGTFYPESNGDETMIAPGITTFWNNLNWVTFGYGDMIYHSSFLFQDVAIPKDATISSAKITFTQYVTRTVSRDFYIYVNTVDDAAAPTSYSGFTGLALSSAVDWNITGTLTGGNTFDTVDITSLVQAIVNRSGWVSGQNMQFVIYDADLDTSSNDCGQPRTIASGSGQAALYVEWE